MMAIVHSRKSKIKNLQRTIKGKEKCVTTLKFEIANLQSKLIKLMESIDEST